MDDMKTAKQVFEDSIVANIDNTVQVTSIVFESPSDYRFKVCDPKWMMVGDSFLDANNESWSIIAIDHDTNLITTLPPEDGILVYGSIIYITRPTLKSGTPLNTNTELQKEKKAGQILVFPIIWLREPNDYKVPPQSSSGRQTFSFTWFCLTDYNYNKDLNDDRHTLAVHPMTQLNYEVFNTIDRVIGLERTTSSDVREFSRFGKDTPKGFEEYLLQLNTAGTSCHANVLVDENHYCKC